MHVRWEPADQTVFFLNNQDFNQWYFPSKRFVDPPPCIKNVQKKCSFIMDKKKNFKKNVLFIFNRAGRVMLG